jgi:hypothetical protein
MKATLTVRAGFPPAPIPPPLQAAESEGEGLSTTPFQVKMTRAIRCRSVSAWGGLVVILSMLRRRWRGSMRASPVRLSIALMPRQPRGRIAEHRGKPCCERTPQRSPETTKAASGEMRAMARLSCRTRWRTRKATPFGKGGLRSNRASSRRKPTTQAFRFGAGRSTFATVRVAFDMIRARVCLPRSSWPGGAASSRSRLCGFARLTGSRSSSLIGCVSL